RVDVRRGRAVGIRQRLTGEALRGEGEAAGPWSGDQRRRRGPGAAGPVQGVGDDLPRLLHLGGGGAVAADDVLLEPALARRHRGPERAGGELVDHGVVVEGLGGDAEPLEPAAGARFSGGAEPAEVVVERGEIAEQAETAAEGVGEAP